MGWDESVDEKCLEFVGVVGGGILKHFAGGLRIKPFFREGCSASCLGSWGFMQ